MKHYSKVVSTLALVIALGGTAYAIEAHSIGSKQLKKNAVKSKTIAPDAVRAADIGANEVDPAALDLPAPQSYSSNEQLVVNGPSEYTKVKTVGTYDKTSPDSQLHVTWTGAIAAGFTGCVFQVRVDGQTDSRSSGEVFVPNGGSATSVAADALFQGLAPGSHSIEIWTRFATPNGADYPCTLNPSSAGIGSTVVVEEVVE